MEVKIGKIGSGVLHGIQQGGDNVKIPDPEARMGHGDLDLAQDQLFRQLLPRLLGIRQFGRINGALPRDQQVVCPELFDALCSTNRGSPCEGDDAVNALFCQFGDVEIATESFVAQEDIPGLEGPPLLTEEPEFVTLLVADGVAEQGPAGQRKAGANAGRGNPTPRLLGSCLRPDCLVLRRVRHADARTVDDNHPPVVQSSDSRQGFLSPSGMVENIGEGLDVELLAGRAIGSGRGRRKRNPLEGGVSLQLANHFLAAAIRIEHLAEESPEGILLGE